MTTKPGSGPADAGIRVIGPEPHPDDPVLSPAALAYVADLVRRFAPHVNELLARRRQTQSRYDAGERPVFPDETRPIREAAWRVAPTPRDLLDRRVEITGPVDRKMIINALNSGANVFMADFEDSNSPTWQNNLEGQVNLRDTVAGTISYTSPEGKQYRLNSQVATLMVRPRGWHLDEKHFEVDGKPIECVVVRADCAQPKGFAKLF